MLLKRFYDDGLAQASYLVGCQATGEALVVDPNRDVDQYLRAAEREELTIRWVTETHIHADYVSGSRELAARSGARILLSDHGGDDWGYRYAGEDQVRLVRDGDTVEVGNVIIEILHTPGHTPEHISFMVTDGAASDRPMGVFTGDFIFVGDVGRPDLLERAAGVAGAMEAGAKELFESLARFRELPDHLQIWPGHGAGSACGRALGAVPSSTLGYEKLVNWAFAVDDEDAFVAEVLAGQPEPPRYFAVMKQVNRDGPDILGGLPAPRRLDPEALADLLDSGIRVVDIRNRKRFQEGHVPGTVNIPLGSDFSNWSGWLLLYESEVFLLSDGGDRAVAKAAKLLAFVGLDQVGGYFDGAALEHWAAQRGGLERAEFWDPDQVADSMDSVHVVDVRSRSEWDEGHLPGATHIHLGYLEEQLDRIPANGPLVICCRTGSRSNIGQSLLLARGYSDVLNMEGGIVEWRKQGLAVEGAS